MPKHQITSCTLGLFLAFSIGIQLSTPVFAEEASSTVTLEEETSEPPTEADEEPELPEDQLVPPEEDPSFKPDPNAPLEEDFLRMRPITNPLYWRLELRDQLGWTNNVDQNASGNASFNNRASLTALARYTLPSNTQFLLRAQGFGFNFFNVTERDQGLFLFSPTISQWLMNNQLNIYTGYIPIFSSSLNRNPNIQRLDHDMMAGAAWYQQLEGGHYLFGGYQADYMLAGLDSFSNLSNLLFAGYRHRLRDDLFAFADVRLQPKGYTSTPEFLDELRAGGSLALQWQFLRPWLILEARGDYNKIMNFTDSTRNADVFSFGINLISAIQSES